MYAYQGLTAKNTVFVDKYSYLLIKQDLFVVFDAILGRFIDENEVIIFCYSSK